MKTLFVIALVLVAVPAFAQQPMINEVFASMTGTDNYEYIELCGPAGMSLNGYAVLVIEGQSTGWGFVDRIWKLDGYAIPADGLFAMTNDGMANQDYSLGGTVDRLENGTETVLLVYDLPASITTSTDVDTNNDGVEEISVGTIIDKVCLMLAPATDFCYYGAPSYGPDGTNFPAGIASCEDCSGDYVFMCFTITGCVDPYADSTPGLPNDCPASPIEENSWGTIKALYR
jgi:hypothetical protein